MTDQPALTGSAAIATPAEEAAVLAEQQAQQKANRRQALTQQADLCTRQITELNTQAARLEKLREKALAERAALDE